jgi:uncharacterized protein
VIEVTFGESKYPVLCRYMEIIGYLTAILIGVSLGMIGGGGSILTVPVLVYLLGIDPVVATAYSLFIVGVTSIAGSVQFYRKDQIDIKTGILFGLPSIIAVFITRAWLVPAIPEEIVSLGNFILTKNIFTMLLFSLLMILASVSMIIKRKPQVTALNTPVGLQPNTYIWVLAEGLVVGVLTGLVGAGGGFLIIPALVILTGMDMKRAVGTSLMIIAVKSLIGFTGDLLHVEMDWQLLLIFTSLSIAGIFPGSALASRIDADKLKKGFGIFVLLMGIYILWMQF